MADRGAQVAHGAQPLEHAERAAREFARGQHLGRNGREQQVRGQYAGVLERADRALGIDEHDVVVCRSRRA